MINWTRTNHVWTVPRQVMIASVATIQEGMALVTGFEGGIVKVQPSTGATSGRLEGVAMSPRHTFGVTNNIVTVTAPTGGGTVLLPNTVTGAVGAVNAATGALVTVSGSAASSSNIQSATDSTTGLTSLTFDVSLAGISYNIVYSYAMAAVIEQTLYGNPYPGFAPSDILQQIGVFKIGRVSVSNFKATANWYLSAGTNLPGVACAANGVWTSSDDTSAAFVPTNVDIIGLPSPGNPWLDLEIH